MAEFASDPFHLLAADSRAALLRALRASDHPLSVDEAAAVVGIGASTARSHLALLVTAGLVTRQAERRPHAGRPVMRYAAAPQSPSAVAAGAHDDLAQLRSLASLLAGHMGTAADPAAAARMAGQRWSDELAGQDAGSSSADPVARLAGMLERLGFEPEQPRADQIWLRRCPFEEVARQHRAVVCGVHLGMLQQTLERLGEDPEGVSLEPFAVEDPLLCIVRLATTGDDGAASEGVNPGGRSHG